MCKQTSIVDEKLRTVAEAKLFTRLIQLRNSNPSAQLRRAGFAFFPNHNLATCSGQDHGSYPGSHAFGFICRGFPNDRFLLGGDRDANVCVHAQPASFSWSCHAE